MNGAKEKRYSANWEKLSRKLKLLYPCYFCGETSYNLKEAHHIDKDKKNGDINNCLVVCKKCHKDLHNGNKILTDFSPYRFKSGYSVKVAWDASSVQEWFDSKLPLKIYPNFPHETAMKFRHNFVKGFIMPGACNYYIGVSIGDLLFGILGFQNPDFGNYDLLLKADTTPSVWEKSTDLLLFALRSRETKNMLEEKFNREINNVYSLCFSSHETIQRYKKHGSLISKKQITGGFNLGYLFTLGTIPSLKEAKAQFIQKSWKR